MAPCYLNKQKSAHNSDKLYIMFVDSAGVVCAHRNVFMFVLTGLVILFRFYFFNWPCALIKLDEQSFYCYCNFHLMLCLFDDPGDI